MLLFCRGKKGIIWQQHPSANEKDTVRERAVFECE
jgi:hypothetical protein